MMGKIPPVPGAERTAGPAVAGPVSGAERTVGRAAAVPGAGTGPARQVTPIALAITLTTALALFLRLLKVGGRVRELTGRIRLSLASSHPSQPLWTLLAAVSHRQGATGP